MFGLETCLAKQVELIASASQELNLVIISSADATSILAAQWGLGIGLRGHV